MPRPPARSWSRTRCGAPSAERLDCDEAGRARGQGLRRAGAGVAAARPAAGARRRPPAARRPAERAAPVPGGAGGLPRDGPGPGGPRPRRGRASARRAWSRSSSARRARPASPATPGWCSTSAPAPGGTRSARSCAACSASTLASDAAGGPRGGRTGAGRRLWWRPTTRCSSTTCSTCRSRPSCAPSTTPWTTRRATRASGARWPRLVERASRARPRLLVVEDLHWADRLTLAQLAELGAAVARVPGAPGHDLADRGRPARRGVAEPDRRRTAADHRPRPAAAPRRRWRWQARSSPRADRFAERCVERAAGNPLFLEQLLRHAEESAGGRRAGLGAEPRAGAHRPARPGGQGGAAGGLGARPALRPRGPAPPARPAGLRPRAARRRTTSSGRRARRSCSPTR